MGVNKVDLANGETLIDLQNDTVTPETLAKGKTAHNAQGEPIIGKMEQTVAKEEIEINVPTITQNGHYELTAPEGKVISKATVEVAVPTQGGGSGIIEVPELPTSNIDENAVYRLTESIQTEKTEVYFLAYGRQTVKEYLVSLGVPTDPNIYVVDDLSNMLESDVQTFSAVNIYILRSDGIAYVYVPAYGGTITLGLFGFQAMGYDKGFTEDIYRESDAGVYTTIATYKQIERWFVRENGKWKEITAHTEATTPHGLTNVDVYSGDVTSKIPDFAELVSGKITEINEEWFRSKNGVYVDRIRRYAFAYCTEFTSLTIPNSIRYVGDNVCQECINLRTVTFKGAPKSIDIMAFLYCDNLTTINVPWSEGEVAGAPWSATNATINYNYTGE